MALTVVTPSYAPDYELCRDLVKSVIANAQDLVEHILVVPRRDVRQFAALGATVLAEEDFLPRTYVQPLGVKYALDLLQPFPPVRGWIRQQILKLAVTNESSAATVLLVDSDIRFVAPFSESDFLDAAGQPLLYRLPNEVTDALPRHVKWHESARSLLGLRQSSAPYPDYVSSLVAWAPSIVRQAIAQVEKTHQGDWRRTIARHLHFSEWTLYGVYFDEIIAPDNLGRWTTNNRCHDYWKEEPLDESAALQFIRSRDPGDIAVMISAKSRTTLSSRRRAFGDAE